jgi:hypothetical protein
MRLRDAVIAGFVSLAPLWSPVGSSAQTSGGSTESLLSAIEARWGKVGDGRKTQNATEVLVRICAHLVRTSDASGLAPAGVTRDVLAGQCIGFFEAQRHSYSYLLPDGRRMLGVCYPGTSNYFPLAKRFLAYALAHPEDHAHGPGLVGWWAALEGWPCAREPSK